MYSWLWVICHYFCLLKSFQSRKTSITTHTHVQNIVRVSTLTSQSFIHSNWGWLSWSSQCRNTWLTNCQFIRRSLQNSLIGPLAETRPQKKVDWSMTSLCCLHWHALYFLSLQPPFLFWWLLVSCVQWAYFCSVMARWMNLLIPLEILFLSCITVAQCMEFIRAVHNFYNFQLCFLKTLCTIQRSTENVIFSQTD